LDIFGDLAQMPVKKAIIVIFHIHMLALLAMGRGGIISTSVMASL